jgi:imidazolonepropionase-like amidohydrolase
VLYGASEGWKVADRIARCGVPVVIGSVWDLPRSPWDPYDAAFANAAVMSRAGVLVAICTADSDNERNLPFHAATAAAFGLPAEEAVRAVTLYPARILGLDGELGSLDAGKRADLVVTDGHLLEITSQVEHVFIDGRRVDHDDNRHTRLANRYRTRLEQLKR